MFLSFSTAARVIGFVPAGHAAVPSLNWNTFLGSEQIDYLGDMKVDSSGNLYVAGSSDMSWGEPKNSHTGGGHDVFVAKLDSSGRLQWHTFIGGEDTDYVYGLTLDNSGNVYVCGSSSTDWGAPVNDFSGGGKDGFVAKLDSNGALQWHTFLGGSKSDSAHNLALDSYGNIYISGESSGSWGAPLFSYDAGFDAFVTKLNSSGSLQWNTFLGTPADDSGWGVAVDSHNSIYVTGKSGGSSGGGAVNPYSGGDDAFVVKFHGSGGLLWHTFLGSAENDLGWDIAVGTDGFLYVAGDSLAEWGNPVASFTAGGIDAFVAKLQCSNGNLIWNTFMGSEGHDLAYDVGIDNGNSPYITGASRSSWGTPVFPFSGEREAFVAKLRSDGFLQWHGFLGAPGPGDYDWAFSITVSGNGNIYVAGESDSNWGEPVRNYSFDTDVFVARIDDLFPWPVFYPAFLRRE